MRDFQYGRSLRIISTIVLSFFIWTFGGAFEIAQAVSVSQKSEGKSQKDSGQHRTPNAQPQGKKRPEEKFSKTVEDIENIIEEERRAGSEEERKGKKEKLRNKKAEIDADDIEIKKQFKETEEKINGLPEEIRKRHREFVKKYDDNLNTLKDNLDEIDKAKTDVEREHAHKKAKEFLEKVKPPKKKSTFDPNKLPYRSAEPIFKEPRTLPEEFTEGKELRAKGKTQKPILVASNGSLDGLLSEKSQYATQNSQPSTQNYLQLALATPPSQADLEENGIEIQFTPAITAKAEELGHSSVKIYNWVRNNIEYVPTYGSVQGADMCLQTKQCNDMDTASLLIALLRVSGIHAKYVYGTIEVPIDLFMNWAGGFSDPNAAMTFMATGGIPGKGLTSGGKLAAVQMEHAWVEAWIDMIPSQGAIHKQGDTWVPLDASYKQYTYKPGMDLYTSFSFNGDQFLNDYIADTQAITPHQYYSQQMFAWLDINLPDATNTDLFGADDISISKVITAQTFPVLLGTLPYKVVVRGVSYAEIPDDLRHKVRFEILTEGFGSNGTSITKSLPELSGKRLTLSYMPATQNDEVLVTQYGDDILKVPPYLFQVRPTLKAEGIEILTGASIGMGSVQDFNMTISKPGNITDFIQNTVVAGTYSAITIQAHKTPVELVAARMQKLRENSKNIAGVTLDDLLGELLYDIGLSYFHRTTFENDFYAKTFQMVYTKKMSEAMTTLGLNVSYLYGMPYYISQGVFNIDVDKDVFAPISLAGDTSRAKQFMLIAGVSSSVWESSIFEVFLSAPSVSAVKLLKIATQRNIPIYKIDSFNINDVLPMLSVSQDVKADIQNAVYAGKQAIVSQTSLQYNEWVGVGYVIVDPSTGAGAYMISGGLAGGGTTRVLTSPPVVVMKDSFEYYRFKAIFFNNVLNTAGSLIGTDYRWGKEDPEVGFDCSGFTQYVLSTAGFYVPRTASAQYKFYKDNNLLFEKPQEGDQFFWKKSDGRIYHTGFVVGVAGSFVSIIHAVEQATSGRYVNKVDSDSYDTESDTKWQNRIASPGFGRPIN